jgi:hypothetical protein
MKVKLLQDAGYFRLVVDESKINEKYNCSQENPIVLAVLTTWEGTKCWSLRDIRLEEVIYPSEHLEGFNLQKYMPKNEEDAKNLKSKLKYFKETPEGEILWGTFCGVVGMGDRTDHPDNPSWVGKAIEGCWSFKEVRKKLKEIRSFWENFEGEDLKLAKMVNPYKQMRATDYKLEMTYGLTTSNSLNEDNTKVVEDTNTQGKVNKKKM